MHPCAQASRAEAIPASKVGVTQEPLGDRIKDREVTPGPQDRAREGGTQASSRAATPAASRYWVYILGQVHWHVVGSKKAVQLTGPPVSQC